MTRPGKSKPRNVVSFWLTQDERGASTALAQAHGMTLNAWVKRLVLWSVANGDQMPVDEDER